MSGPSSGKRQSPGTKSEKSTTSRKEKKSLVIERDDRSARRSAKADERAKTLESAMEKSKLGKMLSAKEERALRAAGPRVGIEVQSTAKAQRFVTKNLIKEMEDYVYARTAALPDVTHLRLRPLEFETESVHTISEKPYLLPPLWSRVSTSVDPVHQWRSTLGCPSRTITSPDQLRDLYVATYPDYDTNELMSGKTFIQHGKYRLPLRTDMLTKLFKKTYPKTKPKGAVLRYFNAVNSVLKIFPTLQTLPPTPELVTAAKQVVSIIFNPPLRGVQDMSNTPVFEDDCVYVEKPRAYMMLRVTRYTKTYTLEERRRFMQAIAEVVRDAKGFYLLTFKRRTLKANSLFEFAVKANLIVYTPQNVPLSVMEEIGKLPHIPAFSFALSSMAPPGDYKLAAGEGDKSFLTQLSELWDSVKKTCGGKANEMMKAVAVAIVAVGSCFAKMRDWMKDVMKFVIATCSSSGDKFPEEIAQIPDSVEDLLSSFNDLVSESKSAFTPATPEEKVAEDIDADKAFEKAKQADYKLAAGEEKTKVDPFSAIYNAFRAALGYEFDPVKLKKESDYARSITTILNPIARIVTFVYRLLCTVLPFIYEKITGIKWSSNDLDKVADFNEVVLRCSVLSYRQVDNEMLKQHFSDLWRTYHAIPRTCPRHGECTKTMMKVLTEFATVHFNLVDATTRNEPWCVIFHSPPGDGKTTITQWIAAALNALLSRPWKEFYQPIEGSEYHDNYVGQLITIWEDFLQATDEETRNQSALHWFGMSSGIPYQLNCASLERKTTTYFKSDYILMSTNADPDFIASHLMNEDAARRRMHLICAPLNFRGNESNHKAWRFVVDPRSSKYADIRHQFPEFDMKSLTFDQLIRICVWGREEKIAHKEARLSFNEDFQKEYPSGKPVIDQIVHELAAGPAGEDPDLETGKKMVKMFNALGTFATNVVTCNGTEVLKTVGWIGNTVYAGSKKTASTVTDYFAGIKTLVADNLSLVVKSILCLFAGLVAMYSFGGNKRQEHVNIVNVKVNGTTTNTRSEPAAHYFEEPVASSARGPKHPVRKPEIMKVVDVVASSSADSGAVHKIQQNLGKIYTEHGFTFAHCVKSRTYVVTNHLRLLGLPQFYRLEVDGQSYSFHAGTVRPVYLSEYDIGLLEFPVKDAAGKTLPEKPDISGLYYRGPCGDFNGPAEVLRVEPNIVYSTMAYFHNQIYTYKLNDEYISTLNIQTGMGAAKPGDCITPILTQSDTSKGLIVGYLVGASPVSFHFVGINYQMIDTMLKMMNSTAASFVTRPCVPDFGVEAFEILEDGAPKRLNFFPASTSFERNDRVKVTDENPNTLHPAARDVKRPYPQRDGGHKTPYQKATSKLQKPPPEERPPHEVLVLVYKEMFKRLLGPALPGVLNVMEYDSAVTGTAHVSGVSMTSSPGFTAKNRGWTFTPYNEKPRPCKTNSEVFDNPEYAAEIRALAMQYFEDPEALAKYLPYMLSFKDETIDAVKAGEGKVRAYCASDLPVSIAQRMVFGDFVSRMNKFAATKTAATGGMNFEDTFANRKMNDTIFKYNKAVVYHHDVEQFDGSQYAYLFEAMAEALAPYYPVFLQPIIKAHFRALCATWIATEFMVCLVRNIMPSGSFVTFHFNSLNSEAMLRSVFYVLGVNNEHLALFTAGDDLLSLRKETTIVTNNQIAEQFRKWNWKVTTPDKEMIFEDRYSVDDIEFCKRRWINNRLLPDLSELKPAGIWKRKKGSDTGLQAMGDALRRARQYADGDKAFNELLNHFLRNSTYSYEELLSAEAGAVLASGRPKNKKNKKHARWMRQEHFVGDLLSDSSPESSGTPAISDAEIDANLPYENSVFSDDGLSDTHSQKVHPYDDLLECPPAPLLPDGPLYVTPRQAALMDKIAKQKARLSMPEHESQMKKFAAYLEKLENELTESLQESAMNAVPSVSVVIPAGTVLQDHLPEPPPEQPGHMTKQFDEMTDEEIIAFETLELQYQTYLEDLAKEEQELIDLSKTMPTPSTEPLPSFATGEFARYYWEGEDIDGDDVLPREFKAYRPALSNVLAKAIEALTDIEHLIPTSFFTTCKDLKIVTCGARLDISASPLLSAYRNMGLMCVAEFEDPSDGVITNAHGTLITYGPFYRGLHAKSIAPSLFNQAVCNIFLGGTCPFFFLQNSMLENALPIDVPEDLILHRGMWYAWTEGRLYAFVSNYHSPLLTQRFVPLTVDQFRVDYNETANRQLIYQLFKSHCGLQIHQYITVFEKFTVRDPHYVHASALFWPFWRSRVLAPQDYLRYPLHVLRKSKRHIVWRVLYFAFALLTLPEQFRRNVYFFAVIKMLRVYVRLIVRFVDEDFLEDNPWIEKILFTQSLTLW